MPSGPCRHEVAPVSAAIGKAAAVSDPPRTLPSRHRSPLTARALGRDFHALKHRLSESGELADDKRAAAELAPESREPPERRKRRPPKGRMDNHERFREMAADGFDSGFLHNIWTNTGDASGCCAETCRKSAYFGYIAIVRTRAYGGFGSYVGLGPSKADHVSLIFGDRARCDELFPRPVVDHSAGFALRPLDTSRLMNDDFRRNPDDGLDLV